MIECVCPHCDSEYFESEVVVIKERTPGLNNGIYRNKCATCGKNSVHRENDHGGTQKKR